MLATWSPLSLTRTACNVARADTTRLYYELWTLRKIAFLSEFEVMWAVETPEGDVARASMIPKEAALQLSYTSLGAAEYRLFDLTRVCRDSSLPAFVKRLVFFRCENIIAEP